jgi:thermitase
VKAAYLDHEAHALALPNDPLLPQQWGPGVIGLPQAWEHGFGSHAVKVAVLDTGMETGHEDLRDNICPGGMLGLGSSPRHGTHVAGIVAAKADNGKGVAGTAQACVMSYAVLGMAMQGAGADGGVAVGAGSAIAWGILDATERGARVISMSLGMAPYDPLLEAAVDYAWARNVLLVAAAGNSGCLGREYPGLFPEVMAVSALEDATTRVEWSGCGEIAAPGVNVLSTLPGDDYGELSGTSMSTPFVSGVAALVLSHAPEFTNRQVRCILDSTADRLGSDTGSGRVNAASAVEVAVGLRASGCLSAPVPPVTSCNELILVDRDDPMFGQDGQCLRVK